MKRKVHGFTLVELLIVAVVLAIFAAIVVPQFASTTDEAKESALKSDLAALRSAIDLYRQQHSEYPGVVATGTAPTCDGGSAGANDSDLNAFAPQLTLYSNAAGHTCSAKDTDFPYGPYLRDDSIPADAVRNVATVVIPNVAGGLNSLTMGADTGAAGGWKYSNVTGKFIANIDDVDSKGVRYDAY
jgi:general secretion pathway protein G